MTIQSPSPTNGNAANALGQAASPPQRLLRDRDNPFEDLLRPPVEAPSPAPVTSPTQPAADPPEAPQSSAPRDDTEPQPDRDDEQASAAAPSPAAQPEDAHTTPTTDAPANTTNASETPTDATVDAPLQAPSKTAEQTGVPSEVDAPGADAASEPTTPEATTDVAIEKSTAPEVPAQTLANATASEDAVQATASKSAGQSSQEKPTKTSRRQHNLARTKSAAARQPIHTQESLGGHAADGSADLAASSQHHTAEVEAGQGGPTSTTNAAPTPPTSGTPTSPTAASVQRTMSESLLPQHTKAAPDAPQVTTNDHVRLVQRVARAMRVAAANHGPLRLRLRPQELGAVRLEVAVDKGQLTAHVETETAAARHIILNALPQLRDRLETLGLRVEQFQVDVGRHDTGLAHDGPSNHYQDPSRRSTASVAPPAAEDTDTAARPGAGITIHSGALNVII